MDWPCKSSLIAVVFLSEVLFALSVGDVEWWYTATKLCRRQARS